MEMKEERWMIGGGEVKNFDVNRFLKQVKNKL